MFPSVTLVNLECRCLSDWASRCDGFGGFGAFGASVGKCRLKVLTKALGFGFQASSPEVLGFSCVA